MTFCLIKLRKKKNCFELFVFDKFEKIIQYMLHYILSKNHPELVL